MLENGQEKRFTNGVVAMSKVEIHGILALSALCAAFIGIFVLYGSAFLWFKWIKKMESILGAPGTAIENWRSDSDDYFTRNFRVQYVLAYFLFLKIPVVGKKIAARAGKEMTPMSKRDRYIGFLLAYTPWLCGFYFGLIVWILKATE